MRPVQALSARPPYNVFPRPEAEAPASGECTGDCPAMVRPQRAALAAAEPGEVLRDDQRRCKITRGELLDFLDRWARFLPGERRADL